MQNSHSLLLSSSSFSFLVFHVSACRAGFPLQKTVNLAIWAFSSNLLHDFTLFGIDISYMHQNRSISFFQHHLTTFTFTPLPNSNATLTLCKLPTRFALCRIFVENSLPQNWHWVGFWRQNAWFPWESWSVSPVPEIRIPPSVHPIYKLHLLTRLLAHNSSTLCPRLSWHSQKENDKDLIWFEVMLWTLIY